MKVIDLLNKIAKGEKVPQNIKFLQNIYGYEKDRKEYTTKTSSGGWHTLLYDILVRHNILELIECEVEILEDKTEEIEEIQVDDNYYIHTELGSFKGRKMDIAFVNKFNELARTINKLNEPINTSKETNCMSE